MNESSSCNICNVEQQEAVQGERNLPFQRRSFRKSAGVDPKRMADTQPSFRTEEPRMPTSRLPCCSPITTPPLLELIDEDVLAVALFLYPAS